jgi:hypothetical protein
MKTIQLFLALIVSIPIAYVLYKAMLELWCIAYGIFY